MLIYANFHIFFNLSSYWTSHMSVRWKEQIWHLSSNIIGLKLLPLCLGNWAQVAWTYAYIEYRHPECHPNNFHIQLSLGLVLEYLSTQVLSLSTHNKYPNTQITHI